jgi:hypothetical protein
MANYYKVWWDKWPHTTIEMGDTPEEAIAHANHSAAGVKLPGNVLRWKPMEREAALKELGFGPLETHITFKPVDPSDPLSPILGWFDMRRRLPRKRM